MPIPRPVSNQSLEVSSQVPGATAFIGGTLALLFILPIMARIIGARSSDIRLTHKDDPRGQLLMQARRAKEAPEERNSK